MPATRTCTTPSVCGAFPPLAGVVEDWVSASEPSLTAEIQKIDLRCHSCIFQFIQLLISATSLTPVTHITPPFDTCTARDNGWESPVPAVLRPSRAPSFPAALVAVRAALVAAAAVRAAGASRSGYFAAAAAA